MSLRDRLSNAVEKAGNSITNTLAAPARATKTATETITSAIRGDDDDTEAETDVPDVRTPGHEPIDTVETYERRDITDEIDDDDVRSYLSEIAVWRRDEPGLSVQAYPTESRIDDLRTLTDRHADDYDLIAWSIRYRILSDDGEIMPGQKLSTRFLNVDEDGVMALDQDFRNLIEQLTARVNDYDAVLIDATIIEAYQR